MTEKAPESKNVAPQEKPKFSLTSLKLDINKLTIPEKLRIFGAFLQFARKRTGLTLL